MTRDEINAGRVITLMNQLHFHKGESLHGAFDETFAWFSRRITHDSSEEYEERERD